MDLLKVKEIIEFFLGHEEDLFKKQVGVLKWPKSIPSRNFWFIMRNNLRLSILIINLTLFACFQSNSFPFPQKIT